MRSLSARLLLIVAISLAPVLAFQALTERDARQVREKLMVDETLRLVRLVNAEQQRIVEGADQVLTLFGGLAGNLRDPELCRVTIIRLLEQAPRYLSAGVFTPDGHALCVRSSFGAGQTLADRDYFRRAIATGQFTIGPYTIGRSSGRPGLPIAKPFFGPDGQIAGVALVSIDLQWLNEQLAKVPLPPGGASSLLDRDGRVLARNPDTPPLHTGEVIADANRFLLEPGQLSVRRIIGLQGRPRIVAWVPPNLEPRDVVMSVGLDVETSFADVAAANRAGTLLILGGGVLALVLTAALGGPLIRRPFRQLLAVADRWRHGDLSARTGVVRDGGDFGRLAVAFDTMAAALEDRDRAVRMALESTSDQVIVLDRSFRCRYLNGPARAAVPPTADPLGCDIGEVFPVLAAGPIGEALRTAMARGESARAEAANAADGTFWQARAFPSVDGLTVYLHDATETRRIDDALRRSEALFRAAFDQATLGMSLVRPDGTLIRLNDRLCEIAGRSREDLSRPGMFREITHPDDRAADDARREGMASATQDRFSISKRYLHPDGRVVWARYTGSLLRDAAGNPDYYFGVIEDITERHRIETALRESEERLRLALEAARMGVRQVDLATGNATATDEAVRIFGRDDVRDATFDGWFANVHPEDQPKVRASWEHALAHPGTDIAHEYRFRRRDGEWRWIASHGRMEYEDGRPVRSTGVIQDITERKQAEAALAESEARLRISQDAGRVGSWDRDLITGRLYWSDVQCRRFGVDPSVPGELRYGLWRAAVHPDDLPRIEATSREAFESGDSYEVEYRIATPEGERWLNGRATVIRDSDGTAIRATGIDIDVTERRTLEDALRRLTENLEARVKQEIAAREAAQERAIQAERVQALGQLAGGIAHDFNNVLQAVMGAMRLIRRRPEDRDGVLRLIEMATTAVERGVSITSRLLTLGRRGELKAEALEVAPLLRGLHEILTHTLTAHIAVTLRIDPDVTAMLADRGQLETVLVNLATNARDAMPDGGELILAAAPETVLPSGTGSPTALAPGRYVRIVVSDTGTGMDAATLARAREPFFTTKKSGDGTGLGLALANSFAEQSGGGMTIESVVGSGTTVTLWLPEAPSGAAAPPEPFAAARTGGADGSGRLRVLLVDDEAAILEVLGQHLEDAGYEVLRAGGGAEAIALAGTERIDGLITDLSMPGLDGLRVIQACQARHPGLPAVLLTGYAGDEAALAMNGAIKGTFSLLRKPVSEERLLDRLRALLAARAEIGRIV